ILAASQLGAGPWALSLLSDLGAEVIKLKSPAGGDEARNVPPFAGRSEEHTSELQSLTNIVCRPLLAKNTISVDAYSAPLPSRVASFLPLTSPLPWRLPCSDYPASPATSILPLHHALPISPPPPASSAPVRGRCRCSPTWERRSSSSKAPPAATRRGTCRPSP